MVDVLETRMTTPKETVTTILDAVGSGDAAAAKQLFPLVYDELRQIAAQFMRNQPRAHTLSATALVHEVYLRLVDERTTWRGRGHFFAVAAKAMRSILVDHARAKHAEKRGGKAERVPLDDAVAWFEERSLDLIALDEALDRLATQDARKSQVVELRFFAGLSIEDVSRALDLSHATIEREWAMARAWLLREVKKGDAPETLPPRGAK